MKVAFFAIGLSPYWGQFDGLLDNLMGCHCKVVYQEPTDE